VGTCEAAQGGTNCKCNNGETFMFMKKIEIAGLGEDGCKVENMGSISVKGVALGHPNVKCAFSCFK
jgi:hypothetical protein